MSLDCPEADFRIILGTSAGISPHRCKLITNYHPSTIILHISKPFKTISSWRHRQAHFNYSHWIRAQEPQSIFGLVDLPRDELTPHASCAKSKLWPQTFATTQPKFKIHRNVCLSLCSSYFRSEGAPSWNRQIQQRILNGSHQRLLQAHQGHQGISLCCWPPGNLGLPWGLQ